MTESARYGWTVLLPVKVLAQAKSRLAVLAGERRRELALALASDTVSAVVACPEVARVIVVTSDPVAGPRLSSLGARVIPEAPRAARRPRRPAEPAAEPGRQPAPAQRGAAARRGGGVAALAGNRARGADGRPARAAPGRAGRGAARGVGRGRPRRSCRTPPAWARRCTRSCPARQFRPMYGGASRARHAAGGATELALDGIAGLRQDVDTPDDLRAAVALGVGPRTAEVAAELLADA